MTANEFGPKPDHSANPMSTADILNSPDFTPEFIRRFNTAISKPPIQGILFQDDQPFGLFAQMLSNTDKVLRQEQICAHGLDHVVHLVQNGFVLKDLFMQEVAKGNISIQDETRELLSDDSVFAFFLLTHDTGYGMGGLAWNEERFATNYQSKGAEFLDELTASTPAENLSEALRRYLPVYRDAVQANTEDLNLVEADEKPHQFTPKEALVLIHDVANYLEYFRAERLYGLNEPSNYDLNPYFFLAEKSKSYQLTSDEETLYYSVELNTDINIPELPDFDRWQERAQDYMPRLWELSQFFAELTGRQFVCSQTTVPRV